MSLLTAALTGTRAINAAVVVDLYFPIAETSDRESDLVYRTSRRLPDVPATITAPAAISEGNRNTKEGFRSSTVDLLTLAGDLPIVAHMLVDETCRGGQWVKEADRRVFTIDKIDIVGGHFECRLEPAQRGEIK